MGCGGCARRNFILYGGSGGSFVQAFDYSFDLEGYIPKERFARLKEFASDKETPFVVLSKGTH